MFLADRNLGKTVVPSAKTMLNTHRALVHPGIVSLDRLKAVSMLLDSINKNIISRDMQAPGLVHAHVVNILRACGSSPRWDEVMISAVIGIGFQATLRPIEISCLGSRAVWWVLHSGEEVRSDLSAPPPPLEDIRGIIMALLPRKNRQGQMSYLPSPAGRVVTAMWKHASNMHNLCPQARFFFPARMQPRRTTHQTSLHLPQQSHMDPQPGQPIFTNFHIERGNPDRAPVLLWHFQG